MIVPPLFQVLFFAYLGRAAELESDTFYVVGNSIQLAALPGLFAMSQAIAGERRAQTLPHLLASPASRLALFLGRGLPVMAIGRRRLARELHLRRARARRRDVVERVAAARARDGGGGVLVHGARRRARGDRAARARVAVFSNLVFAVLLVFCGVNVPLDDLPSWMSTVAQGCR
jgi:ABC-2 type transport system permease protein